MGLKLLSQCKRVIIFWVVMLIGVLGVNSCGIPSVLGKQKDVIIPFSQIRTEAAFKQFRRADRLNKSEILSNFINTAKTEFKKCETVDDVFALYEHLMYLDRYLPTRRNHPLYSFRISYD